MQHERTWLMVALCALGLGGCFTEPGDLGWDEDVGAGGPGIGNAGRADGTAGGIEQATGGTGPGAGGSSGSAGGAPECDGHPLCGGDLVGAWTVTSSCLHVSGSAELGATGLECADAPVTGYLEVSGTWTAHADGTYSDQTITTGEMKLDVPEACLSVSGTPIDCSQMAMALQYLGYSSVSCTPASNGGCTCDAIVDQAGGMGVISPLPSTDGEYTVENEFDLYTDSSDGAHGDYTYCVSSNQMTVRPVTTNAGTVSGTIVLTEQ